MHGLIIQRFCKFLIPSYFSFAPNYLPSRVLVNIMLLRISENKTKVKRNFRESAQFSNKPILDSGNYRHRFTITEKKLINSGTYILMASTYHAGQLGEFVVTIDSSVDAIAKPIA